MSLVPPLNPMRLVRFLRGRPAAPDAPPRALADLLLRPVGLLAVTWVLVTCGFLALRSARQVAAPEGGSPALEHAAVSGDLDSAIVTLEKEIRSLESTNRRLRRQIRAQRPRGLHLVIDTGSNNMYLMDGDTVLRKALVSTGSGVRLADPHNPRSWVFDTPRGEFRVLKKVENPVWTKPDWAFVEAGESLPTSWRGRVEEGVLGAYALDLGDGYLIHGTLFERALGLHVTHGCVRVGAEDLRAIYRSVPVGTRVFII